MKAYLVNAADPVLTVSIEFGIQETDPARAASIIMEHMKTDRKGVLLHKCEPLYLHCGNVFEAVMTQPVRIVALGHVVAKIRKQASDAGVIASHWLLHPALHARGFDAVLLGSTWRLRPSGHNSATSPRDWPRMHASQFSAVTGLGSVSSVRVSQ